MCSGLVCMCTNIWTVHLAPAHGGTVSANISGELEGGTRFKGCEVLTERVRMYRPGPAGRWAPGEDSSGENGIVYPRPGETMQRSRAGGALQTWHCQWGEVDHMGPLCPYDQHFPYARKAPSGHCIWGSVLDCLSYCHSSAPGKDGHRARLAGHPATPWLLFITWQIFPLHLLHVCPPGVNEEQDALLGTEALRV